MKLAVLSDIHANLEALDAVLADLDAQEGIDACACLGDIVGYGPDPVRVVERMAARDWCCLILGNHDLAVLEGEAPGFGFHAAAIVEWTIERLKPRPELMEFLRRLQVEATIADPPVAAFHGSPRFPVEEYVMPADLAWNQGKIRDILATAPDGLTLVGHTHMPGVFCDTPPEGIDRFARRVELGGGWLAVGRPGFRFPGTKRWGGVLLVPLGLPPEVATQVRRRRPDSALPDAAEEVFRNQTSRISVEVTGKLMVNAGSVGQPRDGDPRACYLTLELLEDADTPPSLPIDPNDRRWRLTWHRVPYPVEHTTRKLHQLDDRSFRFQAQRLMKGM